MVSLWVKGNVPCALGEISWSQLSPQPGGCVRRNLPVSLRQRGGGGCAAEQGCHWALSEGLFMSSFRARVSCLGLCFLNLCFHFSQAELGAKGNSAVQGSAGAEAPKPPNLISWEPQQVPPLLQPPDPHSTNFPWCPGLGNCSLIPAPLSSCRAELAQGLGWALAALAEKEPGATGTAWAGTAPAAEPWAGREGGSAEGSPAAGQMWHLTALPCRADTTLSSTCFHDHT